MKHSVKISPERRKDKAGNLIVENIPIFADIRFAGTRLFYFTGYRIDADKFDTELQQVKKNSIGKEGSRDEQYNIMNKRFKAIRATLELYFQSKDKVNKDQVRTLLDDVCKKANTSEPEADNTGFFHMFEKYLKVSKFSYDRAKHAKSLLNQWQRYEDARGLKITFESVTVDLLRDFENYLRYEATKPKARNSKVMVHSEKGINTIHKNLSMTRAFWNFAKGEMIRQGIEITSMTIIEQEM